MLTNLNKISNNNIIEQLENKNIYIYDNKFIEKKIIFLKNEIKDTYITDTLSYITLNNFL